MLKLLKHGVIKISLIIILICCFFIHCKKESIETTTLTLTGRWANTFNSTNGLIAYNFASDISGNIYITGKYSGTANFGNTTCTSKGLYDVFVCKLNSDGVVEWVKSFGNTSANNSGDTGNNGFGITIDKNDNIYVTGGFTDSVRIDNTLLLSAGSSDTYILKLASNGNLMWARQAKAWNADYGQHIKALSNGDIIITGLFYGPSISFSDKTIYNKLDGGGQDDAFIVCYSSSGDVKWLKRLSGGNPFGNDIIYDLKAGNNDNFYITGVTSNNATIDEYSLSANSINDRNFFLIKFDAAGNIKWVKGSTNSVENAGSCLAIDNNDNIIVSGYFYRNISIDDTTIHSKLNESIFLLRFNTDGKLNLAKEFAGSFEDIGIYGGYLRSQLFVATNSKNQIYFSENLVNNLLIDETVLNPLRENSEDLFFAKFENNGKTIFTQFFGGINNDQLSDVCIQKNDDILILGQSNSPEFKIGDVDIHNISNSYIFISKLNQKD